MTGDLPDLLARQAELSADKVALQEESTGRTRTYAELAGRAGLAAAALARSGLRRGDRVGILCRNRIEFFELLFGCARIGAILVPLNWRMPPAELAPLIADFEPRLIFHDGEEAGLAESLVAASARLDLDADYEAWLTAPGEGVAARPWTPAQTWYLIYTSGTTGNPKGVVYTYGMALANYVNIGSCIGLGPADRTLCFLPLFHTAGINLHALPTLFAGGHVRMLDRFESETVVRLIEAREVDTLFAVPTVYSALLDHPRFAAAPLESVRHWGSGGAPLPDALAIRYRDLGVRLCNGMGMTETGPTAFLLDPADAWDRIGSVGKPQLLCRVRIVDTEGREVPDGEVGDLHFAGPGVTPGYWRDEAATRAAFTEDGWLRSGDLARRDADGFYHIAGRRKEMFISGGENVYPIEVENVLRSHPAVADAAVVAESDSKWGEVGRAFVELLPGAAADSAELADFCRLRLASYKVPRRIESVDALPRTSSGKIRKHLLLRSRTGGGAAGKASVAGEGRRRAAVRRA